MTEVIEIIDSKAERSRLVQRTDVLDKVKALATLPGHGEATTAQVADFYEVDRGSVRDVVTHHRGELEGNGYRVLKGADLRKLKSEQQLAAQLKQAPSLALWDRRAVLNLGMLLRDSEVAKEVRRYLLDVEGQAHAAVTDQPAAGIDGLAVQIARSIEDYFGPRLAELEDRIARLEGAPAIEPPEDTGTPLDPGSLSAVLGIPSRDGRGRPLYVGVSERDGLPWARYGSGKRCEWVDRKQVIHAFRTIAS